MHPYTVHAALTAIICGGPIVALLVGAAVAERRATVRRRAALRAAHNRLVLQSRRARTDAALRAATVALASRRSA